MNIIKQKWKIIVFFLIFIFLSNFNSIKVNADESPHVNVDAIIQDMRDRINGVTGETCATFISVSNGWAPSAGLSLEFSSLNSNGNYARDQYYGDVDSAFGVLDEVVGNYEFDDGTHHFISNDVVVAKGWIAFKVNDKLGYRLYPKYSELALEYRNDVYSNASGWTNAFGTFWDWEKGSKSVVSTPSPTQPVSLGLWLYRNSDEQFDQIQRNKMEGLQLAIVNSEDANLSGKTGFLYNEILFCWPIANKSSSITLNDTFASKNHISYQTLINAIVNHDVDDFSGISDSGKSSVVWFQGSMYTSTGSSWAGGYQITIPKSSEVVQRIANENNGADFSLWKNPNGKGFEPYAGGGVGAGSKTHSLKHLLNNGASVSTHNTYRKGKIYHPSFVNINGTYYGPRTIYASEMSNLGQQIQNNYGFANDGGFSSVGDKTSDRIYNVYNYWVNGGYKKWGTSKYYSSREEIVAKAIRASLYSSAGANFDKTIFDISTTIQAAYATTPGFAFSVMKYIRNNVAADIKYSGKENISLRDLAEELGEGSDFVRKIDTIGPYINNSIWNSAGLNASSKWSKENEQKLFSALNEKTMENPGQMTIYYYWVAEKMLGTRENGTNTKNSDLIFSITGFASQLNSAQIGCIRDSGFYYHFLTMGYDLEPVGVKAKMDKDNLEVFVIDLFNAFDLDASKKELIRQGAMNNGASGAYSAALSCLNNDKRKASAIAAAFNKENQVTYQNDSLLTTSEIEKGKIEASADSLDAGYVPYVVVVKQSQKDCFAINKVSDFTFSSVESGYQKMQTISSLRKTNGQVKDKTYDEAMQKFGSLYFYEQFADFEPNPYVDVLISFGKDNASKKSSKEIDTSTFYGESTKDKDKYANVSQAFGLAGKSLATTVNTNNSRIAANQNVYQKDFILLNGKQSGTAAKFIRIPYRKSTVDLRGNGANSYVAASSALLTLDGTPTVNLRTSLEDEYARYFMASFSIDSFGTEYNGGKLLHNKFGTNTAEAISLDAYGKDVATKLSVSGASNRDTKNAHIYAMMGGASEDVTTKNGTKRYSIAEPSVYLWANSHNGTFGNLLKKIFKNEKYTSFASGQTVSIKVTNAAVTNYGFNGSLGSLQMTGPEVQSLNDELNTFARDFNLNGIIGQSGFQSLNTDYAAEKLAAIISCIFDENEIVEASYEVVAESEDLLISNSHQDTTTVKIGSKDSLNRKTIDWFQGGESQFDFTCTMTNDLVNGPSAIDGTYTTGGKWMLKKDTSAKDLNSKTILYGRNTNSNPRIDTGRVIKGYVYAGRIPEATRSGLKVSDYTIHIVEDFYTDGNGVSDETFTGADYRKALEQLYSNANSTDARKNALDSMHHAYASGVLYNAFRSQTVLSNIKVTPSKIISVSNTNVSKPSGGKIGNGSLGKVETSYIPNQAWAPGMVVKYYYEYYLPQGSQSSWVLYIQSKTGSVYAKTFDKTQMSSISSVLLKFVLSPSNIDNSMNLSIFDKNIKNNSLYLGSDISDGGNFYWDEDQKPAGAFNGTTIQGSWDKVSSTLNLQIPESLENGTIDSNGVLLKDVKITIWPTLRWDSLMFGDGGTTFHTKAQQGIYADLAGMQGVTSSRINQTVMLSNLIPTDGISQGIGTDRIVSPFKTRYSYTIIIPRGTVIMSKRETPTIDLWVPGSKHRDNTACGGNEINCTADNSITNDRDCIHITFEGVGTPRDNKIVDIVLSANNVPGYNTTTQILAIGKNNYNVFDGSEQDAQSIVYYDSSKNAKVMPSNLRITALVERGSLPSGYSSSKMSMECRPNEINQYIKMYWCLSYSDAGRPFNTSTSGTSSDWSELTGARLVGNNQTRNFVYPDGGASINFTTQVTGGQQYPIMCNVGDKLAWEYDVVGASTISSLSVSCGYRIQGDAFDNMDVDLNNNQRTEKWESVIDVVAKTTSVPNTILTGTTTIQCNNAKVEIPHSATATYTTTHKLSTFMEGVELTNQGSNIFDLSWIGGTVQIYAKQGGTTFYPSSLSCNATGDVGTYTKGKNGKFHIYTLTPEITITATWTGCTFQPGEVDWYVEFWPWVDNVGPNGYVPALYATDLRSGKIPNSDAGQSSSLSIETIPWKGNGVSTNNRDYAETPVVQHSNVINETPDPYCVCKQNKYEFLANEVRWTDRFKWYDQQFAIADWHTLNPNAGVDYGTYRLSGLRFGSSTTFGAGSGTYGIGWMSDRVSGSGNMDKGKAGPYEGHGPSGWSSGESATGVWAPNGKGAQSGDSHAGTDLQYTYHNLYHYESNPTDITVVTSRHPHDIYKPGPPDAKGNPTSVYDHTEYDTWYRWKVQHYRENRTLEPTLTYGTSACRTYIGPDQSTWNWGPNGMTDGQNYRVNIYVPSSKGETESQDDEVGWDGAWTSYGSNKYTKIPTKYFNYIYKASSITNRKIGGTANAAPATHGQNGKSLSDKSMGNWDSLSIGDIEGDYNTPGRTKYNFYAEKIQVSFLVYSSRKDGTLKTPIVLSGAESNKYTVYNGESFKVHVRVTYVCNRTKYHLPASPIQNIPYPQSGETNVIQSVKSGGRHASVVTRNSGGSAIHTNSMGARYDGIYFRTATVGAGTYTGHYAEYVWVDLNEHDHVSIDSKFIRKTGGKTPTTPVIGGGVMGGMFSYSGTDCIFENNPSQRTWDGKAIQSTWLSDTWNRGNARIQYWHLNQNTVDHANVRHNVVSHSGAYTNGGYALIQWSDLGSSLGNFGNNTYVTRMAYNNLLENYTGRSNHKIDNHQGSTLPNSSRNRYYFKYFAEHGALRVSQSVTMNCNKLGIDITRIDIPRFTSHVVSQDALIFTIKGSQDYSGTFKTKPGKKTTSTSPNFKYVYDYYVFPLNTSGTDTVDIPHNNIKQDIYIYAETVPSSGMRDTQVDVAGGGHPYGTWTGTFGINYLCDRSMLHIEILPTTAIIGTDTEIPSGLDGEVTSDTVTSPDTYVY